VLTAEPYREEGEWFVALYLDGEEFEVAGPFDEEHDALGVAHRATGVL